MADTAEQAKAKAAEVDARFAASGKAALERAIAQDPNNAPKPTVKVEEKKEEPKPRDDKGRFEQKENLVKMREELASAVRSKKETISEVATLRAELAEIKSLLTKPAPKPPTPEEADADLRSRAWADRYIRPVVEPVLEAEKRRQAAADEAAALAEAQEATTRQFDRWKNIRGLSEDDAANVVRAIVRDGVRGQDALDTFELAFEKLGLGDAAKERQEADRKAREEADAAKKAATGLMGRSTAAPEVESDSWYRDVAEAKKNKDDRRLQQLMARRFEPLKEKFLHGAPASPQT